MEEVQKGLHELFKYVFITNCHLDESSITAEEMTTLEELDMVEVLDNFRDLVIDLLNFKKEFKSTNGTELSELNQQYQTIIQKLEGEIRNHIRTENQLKLQIELAQSRLDFLDKKNTESERKKSTEKKPKEPKTIKKKSGETDRSKDIRKPLRRQTTRNSCKSLNKSEFFKTAQSFKAKPNVPKSIKSKTFVASQHSRSSSEIKGMPAKRQFKKV